MLEEHLACPKCGYDLHGIPEVRCPECGFRYDAAALRDMAASAEWKRLVAARDTILKATIAAALTMPTVCDGLGIPTWAQLCVVGVAYVIAFFTWILLTDGFRGLGSVPHLLTLFVAIGWAMTLVVRFAPTIALVPACVALAFAWVTRLCDWGRLSPPSNVRSPELRRSVVRHSVAGMVLLVVATLLVLFALAG